MRKIRLWCATAFTTASPSAIVRVIGFSHQMSLPASAAAMEISACQWGGVAIWMTSMSLRAMTSRKSR